VTSAVAVAAIAKAAAFPKREKALRREIVSVISLMAEGSSEADEYLSGCHASVPVLI
jgi:hypothetical protein